MISRGKQRELALQSLYMYDIHHGDIDLRELEQFSWNSSIHLDSLDYAPVLLNTVLNNLTEIDSTYKKYLDEDKKEVELFPIDIAILRIGIAEMCILEEQSKVVIDEAVKLAHKFSGEYSYKLINGILHAVKKNLTI